MKKFYILLILTLLTLPGLFAFGKKETVNTPAKTLDSWLETVDIKDKKPGKYNIMVTAGDLAGNQGLAGPYNVYIDPNSDLPIARITNPLEQMRVPGNLNVVGTCIDDDDVAYVELIIDGAETPVQAEGTEFWSYYLDTNGLSEGKHTISVYGVDIFGVAGNPFTITWNLDRNRPETEVQNKTMGDLVSGKFILSGKVNDGNGIKRLSYSLNNGKTFEAIPLKFNKKESVWTFSLLINSLPMPDGPSVCWFKAEDGQGSEGIYTFLYFVDNTKPAITFISPDVNEKVNGIFSVSGMTNDAIGIASLSWRMGKATGSFDLIKGNPYWIKEFDIRGIKTKTTDVEITAVDIAGNKTVATRRILVDSVADIPLLALLTPVSGAKIEETVTVSGFAKDDDEIAEIYYSLDKGAPVSIPSKGQFGVILQGLATGNHSVEVWPVDINGTRGASSVVSFVSMGTFPEIKIDPIATDFSEISSESGVTLSATIASSPGLKSVTYTVAGMNEKTVPVKLGSASASLKIPVTPNFPYGLVTLEINAIDIYDRLTQKKLNFYITNLGIPRDARPEFSDAALTATGEVTIAASGKIPASTGTATVTIERILNEDVPFANGMNVTLAGPGFSKDLQKNNGIRLGIDSPVPVTSISWSLNGGAPSRTTASKPAGTRSEAIIPLSALLPATWTKIDATVTFKDLSTLSVSGLICIVRPAPVFGIFDDEQFVWGTAKKNPAGSIELFDGQTITGMYNGKPDLTAASVSFDKPYQGLNVELSGNTVTVTGTKDGEYSGVSLIITDSAGKTFKTAPVTFIVDTALPLLAVDTSERPLWLQNTLAVKGSATDSRGISSVEYSFDNGLSWKAFSAPVFDQKIDISALPDGQITFLVRAIDKVGRTVTDWRVFLKDTQAPEATVVLPAVGHIVNGQTSLAFHLSDASPLASAEYRAPGDRSTKDRTEWLPLAVSTLTNTIVGTKEQPLSDKMEFRFTDIAGNSIVHGTYGFVIDANADLPIVQIHVPAENEVVRKDFIISGVVYDDDMPAKVWYKIDNGTFAEVPIENSYSVPIALSSLTDNEHTITVYAEDIYGLRGPEVVRKIRVSLEEPKAEVKAPTFEMTNKGVIDLSGVASDKNAISRLEISLDNGNSWNLATGAETWSYRFDTRVIEDGTHVVFIRVYDMYETMGLYSSLINIDNTAPSIKLELPLDGSRSSEMLFISGQTLDNIGLDKVSAKISNIDPKQPIIPSALTEIPFENELIISRSVEIQALPEGFYNLEVRGYDKAGNITRISRNFEVFRGKDRNRIEFLYPMNGEKIQGVFNIYGRVVSEDPVDNLLLFVDGTDVSTTEVTPSGYFKFTVSPEMIVDGGHKLNVRALVAGDKVISSEDHTISYTANGPWISIDNFAMGDFAIERPYLMGSTGYSFTEDEVLALKAKDTTKEAKRILQAKSLQKVEISFDNGKTFLPTEFGKKWRYRLETGDMREGYHFLIVRSTMNNGEVAVSRSIIQIDKTLPSIRLISPGEGGRYNNELVFSGLSSDDVKLDSVLLSLRPGDKSAYAVPSFIQGLYFDAHFWGATLYDVGLGLTFFDDNVKLQFQYGQFTREQWSLFSGSNMRYGGDVMGIKLLANLAMIPLEYLFGPDFSWLSATGSVGANFSYFSESQSGKPQILTAAIAQFEFPRITIPKRKVFRTFSLYTEGQLWFIPTDVDSSGTTANIQSLVPHVTGGVRVNIF